MTVKSNKQRARYGTLVNRLKVPITISYKGEGMVLSPCSKKQNIDLEQVGAIPNGVLIIPNK